MMQREKEIYKVTILGGIVNTLLLIGKFVAGIMGNSAAMVADAVHSLSDFVSDIIVLIFVKISNKPQDESHDYGHGKYETLATTMIGVALLVVAIGLIVNGSQRVAAWYAGEQLAAPDTIAFWAAIASVVLKELTFQYTIIKARQVDSSAMRANAWHHRSDALSSIGTSIGIGGAIWLGQRWTVLDPIASIVVAAVIVKVAIDVLKNGVDELTESSLPESVENEILSVIAAHPDVVEPHHLRTRRIGNRIAIEVHLRMDGDTSLRESHARATEVEHALKNKYGQHTHVSIHMEPIKG